MKTAVVTARFAGTCEACRRPIEVGDRIVPCAGVYGAWDHERCGVTGASSGAQGWLVTFVDGHEEFYEAARLGRGAFTATALARDAHPGVAVASTRREYR